MLQPGQHTITTHILLNISQSKNHVETEAGRLVTDPFLFFKKALQEVKANGLQLWFNIL